MGNAYGLVAIYHLTCDQQNAFCWKVGNGVSGGSTPEQASQYHDFEILVRSGKRRDYPIEIRSSAGEFRATMHFPFTPQALKFHLQDLENALLRSASTRRVVLSDNEQPVQEFGAALFDALIDGDSRSLYDQSRHSAESEGKGLRLKLRIDTPDLASLPWEVLYDRRQADYLALSSATPIVRDFGLAQPIEPLSIAPPLRILGLVANPSDMELLSVDNERRRIEEALAQLQERGLIELRWLEEQTWRALQQEIRRGEFHVLHFIGHGGFDPQADEGLIMLENEAGKARPLPATDLATLLADEPELRLVVLNSCDGARGGAIDIFSSTASILVRRGIPAVLAMQHEISDPAAIEFARSFYEAVADGLPVERAVAEGRKSIRLAMSGSFEWVTPVLFQRASDGLLFMLNRSAITAPPPDAAPEPKVPVVPQDSSEASGDSPAPNASLETIPSDAEVGQGDRRSLRSYWASVPAVAKIISGVLSAAAALITALVAAGIIGGSDPNPGITPTAVVANGELGGTLSNIAISDQNLLLNDFCQRRNLSCEDSTTSELQWPGTVISYQIETVGYEGRELPITWSMYDADTNSRVSDPALIDQPGWPDGVYTPAAYRDQNSGELFIANPTVPGRYYVRLELSPREGARLDVQTTEPFVVS